MAYPYGNSPLTTVTFFFDHSRHHSPLKLCKGTVRAILHHCFGAVLYSDRENDDEFRNDDDEIRNDDDEIRNDDDEIGNDDDEIRNDDDEIGNDDDEVRNDDNETVMKSEMTVLSVQTVERTVHNNSLCVWPTVSRFFASKR